MPHRPAVLADNFVRLPSSTHHKGIKFLLDHVNSIFDIVDETEEYFPFIQTPKLIAPELWLVKESIGWKYVADELWGYVGGNPHIKISATDVRFYNAAGAKKVHIDLTNGNIYLMGRLYGDGIDMPAD